MRDNRLHNVMVYPDKSQARPKTGAGLLIVAVLLMAALSGGCDGMVSREQVVWHPIIDSLSISPEMAVRIPKERRGTVLPSLSVLEARLQGRVEETRIGVLEGDPEYLFGELVDGLFLSGARIALLDRQASQLRIYDSTGVHISSLGGPGEGPGEFGFPVSVVRPRSGGLWVIEGARGIQRFEEVGRTFTFRDRLPLESYSVRDGCVTGESVVVHIPSHITEPDQRESADPTVLFKYDSQGMGRFGFAVPYRYSPQLASERMKRGQIACGLEDEVFLAFDYQNRLDSYRVMDGSLLWSATFEGIDIPRIRERIRPDGRIGVGIDVRGGKPIVHFLLGISGGEGKPLVVQFGRRTREQILSQEDGFVIETFLVDPTSGAGLFIGEDLPQILSLDDDRVLLLRTDPYPEVEVARLPVPQSGG